MLLKLSKADVVIGVVIALSVGMFTVGVCHLIASYIV